MFLAARKCWNWQTFSHKLFFFFSLLKWKTCWLFWFRSSVWPWFTTTSHPHKTGVSRDFSYRPDKIKSTAGSIYTVFARFFFFESVLIGAVYVNSCVCLFFVVMTTVSKEDTKQNLAVNSDFQDRLKNIALTETVAHPQINNKVLSLRMRLCLH